MKNPTSATEIVGNGEESSTLTLMTGNQFSVYFHIPFCTRKCGYCNFFVLPDKDSVKNQLAEALALEWKLWKEEIRNKKLVSIYFGGGTPSLWGPEHISMTIEMVLQHHFKSSQLEITLEANPENVSLEQMYAYKKAGVNRISIGVQSFDNRLLSVLTRTHSAEKSIQSVHEAVEAGIENVSIDLMYDIPHQTLDQWRHSLQTAASLPITHLSLYNLTFEPHTLFHQRLSKLRGHLPDTKTSARMYCLSKEIMEKAGLFQYEISAFAKPGRTSLHNGGYWTGREFAGLGPSAFSYWGGKRFSNIAHMGHYSSDLKQLKRPISFEEELNERDKRRELFILRLRLIQGCRTDEFEYEYGRLDPEIRANVARMEKQDFLDIDQRRTKLTEKGVLFFDTVAAELI